MLAFGWNEKVEYTRDCCYALLDRLNMSMFQLGKSKVGIQIRVINGRETTKTGSEVGGYVKYKKITF